MSIAPPWTQTSRPGWFGFRRLRRRTLAAVGVVLLSGALVTVVGKTLGGGGGSQSGASDNGSATATASVTRRSLSSQIPVSATLGYAGSASIVVPPGTAPADLLQARQTVASARAALQPAQATLAADRQELARAQAQLAAARRKQASDCGGSNAAATGSGNGGSDGASDGSSRCATAAQAVATAEQAAAAAQAKLTTDLGSFAAAKTTLAGAEASLAAAEATATIYGQSSAFTMLPPVGRVIRRDQTLYRISGRPVILFSGSVTPWRVFRAGMSPGRDVAELNANLRALGYGRGLSGDRFSAQTATAIKAFQAAHGLGQTGSLLLGSVVFKPWPVRVTSVTPTLGAAVQPGEVLAVSSTARRVTIALDATHQAEVRVGDPVTITLPDNRTTPGVVSSVSSVATTPSSDDPDSSSTPTVEVQVTPTDPAATGRLDQAPVNVSITTATVENALVVPVNALLALAGGGYGVEEIGAGNVRRIVPVEVGLFDDSQGLVQVTGNGVRAGQRIVVPSS
jgi:peptidoglycan hydrolase-like protein with peptidoglycan-binding domain